MKERWKYGDYVDEETEKPVYYRIKQRLAWQYYLRIVKRWFTPCIKCQEEINEEWKGHRRRVIRQKFDFIEHTFCLMCNGCRKAMDRVLAKKADEVILGNKDYEPAVELQRHWIDVEKKNENGVWDSVSEEVTKEEYYKVKGWKL